MESSFQSPRLSSRLRPFIPLLIAGFIILLLALMVWLAPPKTLSTTIDSTDITLTAEPGLIFAPGGCVTLRWQVLNIQALYLNGEGRIGEDSETVCLEGTTAPQFEVVLPDGSNHTFALDVGILLVNPLTWLLLLIAGVLTLTTLYNVLEAPLKRLFAPLFTPLRRMLPTIARVGLMTLLTLVVLEFGFRLYITNFGSEIDRARYLYSGEEIRARSGLFQELPFVIYTMGIDNNALGYRGALVDVPKPAGVYRIVAIGGSTTFGAGMDWQFAYPAQLQTVLHEDFGYTHVEVVNAGVLGYTTWNSLVNFEFRILELDPDLIIIYHATNDAFTRHTPHECYAPDNRYLGLNPRGGVWRQQLDDPGPSALYRFIAINTGLMSDPTELGTQFVSVPCAAGDEPFDEDAAIAQNPPTYFERNIRSMIAIAHANDVDVLLSSWVYHDTGAHPNWWRTAIVEHNAVIANLADEMDTYYYDLVAEFPVNPDVWLEDDAHLNRDGTHLQAEHYAAYLVDARVIPPPDDDAP